MKFLQDHFISPDTARTECVCVVPEGGWIHEDDMKTPSLAVTDGSNNLVWYLTVARVKCTAQVLHTWEICISVVSSLCI